MLDEKTRDLEVPGRASGAPTTSAALASGVAGLFVTVVRLIVSRSRTSFAIWPDEPAQLAMARLFGGGTRWYMHDHSTWKPGYALVISPVYWFSDDATTVFRFAMFVNAVLGGLAAVLLVHLTRRLTSLSPWRSALAATVVMSAPASLFVTDFAWSESLVVALFLASVLALVRFDESPSLGHGAVVAALVTAAFLTHSRMLALAVIAIGVMLVAAVRGRVSHRDAAVGVALLVLGVGVVRWTSQAVVDRLWRDPADTNTVGAVVERATDLGPLAVAAAGQWWYLAVSSLGVVGFGVWGIAQRIRSGDLALRRATTIVAAATAGCVALSIVFMSARVRPDRIVYGRYNDSVMAPVLVVGLAVLVGSLSARRLAIGAGVVGGSLLAAAAVLGVFRADPLAADNGVEPMILGLQPFIAGHPSIAVVPITVAAIAFGAALLATVFAGRDGGRRRVPGVALIATFLLLGGLRTAVAIDKGWTNPTDTAPIEALAEGPLAGAVPADFYIAAGSDDTKALMTYQFALPRNPFNVIADLGDSEARYVVAPSDADWPTGQSLRRVWSDPARPISLWERRSPDS